MSTPDIPSDGSPSPEKRSENQIEFGVSRERLIQWLNIFGEESSALLVLALKKYGPHARERLSGLLDFTLNLKTDDLEYSELSWEESTIGHRLSTYEKAGILMRSTEQSYNRSYPYMLPSSPEDELICAVAAIVLEHPLITHASSEAIFGFQHNNDGIEGTKNRWSIFETLSEINYFGNSDEDIIEIPSQQLSIETTMKPGKLNTILKGISNSAFLEFESSEDTTKFRQYKALRSDPLSIADIPTNKRAIKGTTIFEKALASVQNAKDTSGKQIYKTTDAVCRDVYSDYDTKVASQESRREEIGSILSTLGQVNPPYVIRHEGLTRITYGNFKRLQEFVRKIHAIQRGDQQTITNALIFGDTLINTSPESAQRARDYVRKSRSSPIPEVARRARERTITQLPVEDMTGVSETAARAMQLLSTVGSINLDPKNEVLSSEYLKTVIQRLGGVCVARMKGLGRGEINLYFVARKDLNSDNTPKFGVKLTKLTYINTNEDVYPHIGLQEGMLVNSTTIHELRENPKILTLIQGDGRGNREKGYQVYMRRQAIKLFHDSEAKKEYNEFDAIIQALVNENSSIGSLQTIQVNQY